MRKWILTGEALFNPHDAVADLEQLAGHQFDVSSNLADVFPDPLIWIKLTVRLARTALVGRPSER